MFDRIAETVQYQKLDLKAPVHVTIKRLDQIHPKISGNKFFKLKYNFLEAQARGCKHIITFGGAYSNHIAATAYAAHLFGFQSIGIIRGEELATRPLNHTLATAQQFGMQLQFVSREKYRLKETEEFIQALKQTYPESYIIPEGGTNTLAIQGCQEILSQNDLEHYDVICCAVGTGGTITGLIEASAEHQQILGFSALKGDFLAKEVALKTHKKNWEITDAYCCSGYAKTTIELLQFIEKFEQKHQIPLEHIYTGKMLFGILDLIKKKYFEENTRILVIHSGGLQGRLNTATS
ncbi:MULTISPECIES: pyridoxal-phosphate dependent enzyme [unclassified Acinetobacter]|uniref:1-aminocyclopropane-1-carboxylate deaminase/D-cysteine desulfhydrase n=1 Tax=unclassified Acinetobacter TaxID=196816 RepID=UPI002577DDBD|nr:MULTISPECIES: pyridoxal-phosphate dependent enzyme [unclassified Acinetobacter]MDM1762818.1 1-aminocyclopropane-1-carboxylate deaminase/D-cysteine desulfhydrase [Acinetobacter sp. 226-1]MDM1766297.1 1-aminocyclopropane-1-carboxylate deaminase/D-cysteine desulfhydrase [Acinetobacter sp. 226-4]